MRHSYRPDIPPQPQPYRTQVLDHLGLVAGMFEELGITEVIDRATQQDPEMPHSTELCGRAPTPFVIPLQLCSFTPIVGHHLHRLPDQRMTHAQHRSPDSQKPNPHR